VAARPAAATWVVVIDNIERMSEDLKPHDDVQSSTLQVGTVYFAVNFIDGEMLLPQMEPLVFQDVDSFRRGMRYSSTTNDDEETTFYTGAECAGRSHF